MTLTSTIRTEQSALAIERLTRGLKLSAVTVMLLELVVFIADTVAHPRLGFSIAAWIVLAAVAAFTLPKRFGRYTSSTAGFAAICAACALVVTLNIVGTWNGRVDGPYPQAAVAVGGILLICVNTRRAREIMIATGVLGVTLAVAFLNSLDGDLLVLGTRVVVGLLAVAPPIIGVRIVRSFRTLVQIESDRVQVQATVSAPGIALGLMASKELARLDLDAERLLDSVATGQAELPLNASAAASAASIATELRLYLIAGRGRTWLYHAVTESAVLGPAVTITDPDGLAALLSTGQRDAVLSAVWLFVGDLPRTAQMLRVELGRPARRIDAESHVAIGFEADGVPRRQVDPAVWHAIGKVGQYTESNQGTVLRIDIDCRLEQVGDWA